MNFLAHIYLSGGDEEVMTGNFLGDFVKGNMWEEFSGGIAKGIHLHRSIDHFTDRSNITARSRQRISEKYRHYSGVITDIFYDHFLAKKWNQYSTVDLEKFTNSTYKTLEIHRGIMPEKAQYVLTYMQKQNWLYNYQYIEGLRRTFGGMARRTSFKSNMEYATEDLQEQYRDFEMDFDEFFPTLQAHCKEFLKENV